jgi:gliding motility-associated-like protein
MKNFTLTPLQLLFIIALIIVTQKGYATHAQGGDITYTCLGNNQYQVRVAFYRDCSGAGAPQTINVNANSQTCNQNFNITLNRIQGTGIDVTPVCPGIQTTCAGGNYPGVQQWIFQANVTLPMQCVDWKFSFSLCCRNNAITTINNPGGQNIYIEALLNNLDAPCNNSPQFTNLPVPYICVGQQYCFNHGAVEPDGDVLTYQLITPLHNANTPVTYLNPYSSNQPLNSNPAVTFNTNTGDICMTPQQLQVTVMAVRVNEYRNGILVGSVIRDIQIRVINCNNNLPNLSGINGTNNFTATACAGATINFNIISSDNDVNQQLTVTWNNGINGATFTTNGGLQPTATFTWTPNANNIGNTYCFTATVSDNSCPLNGSQTYSYCINVIGMSLNTSATASTCNNLNGSASVTVSGGTAPYTYLWSSGSNQSTANNLAAGNYTVTVSDANGCSLSQNVTVPQGSAPANLQLSMTPVSCNGTNTGSASVVAQGGDAPYTYLWNTGSNNPTINNLSAGNYTVTVTTATGCTSIGSIQVTQPASAMSYTLNQNHVSCFGANDGSININVSGGTPPYSFVWNITPSPNSPNINNLPPGNYSVTVYDANSCLIISNIQITEPQPLVLNTNNLQHITCFGGNNGYIQVAASGGTAPYTYSWSNNSNASFINNLTAGNYTVTLTDANGCMQNQTYTINQPPQLIANIASVNQITCFGANDGNANIVVNGGVAPYNISWNTTPVQFGNQVTNLSAGNYSATITDANLCNTLVNVQITEPLPMQLTASGSTTICPGLSTNLSATASGGTGNYSYTWNNGAGTGQTVTVTPMQTTTYIVTATDSNGCMSPQQTVTVTVNDINLYTFYVTAMPESICLGQSVNISASVSNNIGNYTITWNNNLPNGNGPHTDSPTQSGWYTATLTDACNNTRIESAYVTVNPLPQVELSPQSLNECGNANITLSNNQANIPGSTYQWNFGDGYASANEVAQHSYTQTGTYHVTLVVTSPAGCVGADATNVNVIIRPQSVANFLPDNTSLSIFKPEVKFMNYSQQANIFNWNFGDGNTSTLSDPQHTYSDVGTYPVTLIANNIHNCPDTLTLNIYVNPEFTLYIPNAFSPDGDGINDTFFAKGENIELFEMYIYNRWGENIFTSNNINNSWDGTHKNNNEPKIDVYVYKIKVKDSVSGRWHYYEGHVSIVK